MLLRAIFVVAVGANAASGQPVTVVSYYFGNYHPGDPRNVKSKGTNWSEWDLVKNARPRFAGHQQPRVPIWGYTDESKPEVMAQKIAAAADHGISAFVFDWYYYDDGPFLEAPIDRGFLQATNNGRLKFALMWANHDWMGNLFPHTNHTPWTVLYPGKVSPASFEKICDHLIRDYFSRTNYWRLDGKPYFSFYELQNLLADFGSVEGTRAALDRFRGKAKAAGLPGLHLNAVVWGNTILPVEKTVADPAKLIHALGFDSVTSYVWIHHTPVPEQQTEYIFVRDRYFDYWSKAATNFGVPYIPNVTMGWDPSPRAEQSQPFDNSGYPFMNTIKDNTPENFRATLGMARQRLLAEPGGLRILNLNCWNEWTEGSYLEPDTVHGTAYLDAVKQVFGVTR